MKTIKPDSRQIRVSHEVLLAIIKEQDPKNPLEKPDAILRRKFGLKPKGRSGKRK